MPSKEVQSQVYNLCTDIGFTGKMFTFENLKQDFGGATFPHLQC